MATRDSRKELVPEPDERPQVLERVAEMLLRGLAAFAEVTVSARGTSYGNFGLKCSDGAARGSANPPTLEVRRERHNCGAAAPLEYGAQSG